ncbi:Vinorine synthase [Morus notabilis]|uniref:Vinorine synthase n=1 Tax=Morus notabilis TaxID=981085 RepID=W9RKY0_9ROSA|nr:vinorine synthase [Morus notabilis]EXB96195.1 Vinorine synthase [Morus notabilis]
MQVITISREYVKPSNPFLHHLKPYKLCLFDQLTPLTYPPGIIFYPNAKLGHYIDQNHNFNNNNYNGNDNDNILQETLAQLKKSLSEALNLHYPFAGRIKNNLYVDDFDAGLLYVEARVNCRMSEYFKLRDTESLDHFLPFPPFRKEAAETSSLPQVAFQVNIFACGGIALGISLSHKFCDGATVMYLLKTWAAEFTNSPEKVVLPNLAGASSAFPPRDLPQSHLDLMDEMWFKETNYVTKRFVFDAKAIATLRAKAKSDRVPKPSRNEALTGFIWKHATAASWAVSGSPKLSVAAHAVNMRPRVKKPYSLENSTGNLFWWAFAAANPANETERELHQLVGLLKEVLEGFDNDFLESMHGQEGFAMISELLSQIEAMFSMESEKPDIFAFTGWNGLFNDIDFGWGKPFWVGVMGKVGPVFRNLVVFIDAQWGKGIEAWITLEEKQMKVLESDKEFLAFAALNPGISSL